MYIRHNNTKVLIETITRPLCDKSIVLSLFYSISDKIETPSESIGFKWIIIGSIFYKQSHNNRRDMLRVNANV